MEKRIVLENLNEEAINFVKEPDSIKKNIIYNDRFKHRRYSEASILIKEDNPIYYASSTYKLSKGKKFYLKKEAKEGFTVEPKGKMKIWFGRNINTLNNMNQILIALNKEWVKPIYLQYITPSIMGKIIVNKITNPHDLFKSIIKMYRTECSISKLIDIVEKGKVFISKNLLLKGIYTAKNLDHYLDYLSSNPQNMSNIFDMMDQASILERKINFRWSKKRMALEHKKWTEEIMSFTSENLSKDKLEWLEQLSLPTGKKIKLIDNESDCYMEGKMMHHCVYTSYWNTVKNKKYIIYHINDDTSYGATLGLAISGSKIRIHQLTGSYNNTPSPKAKELSQKILDNIIINNKHCFQKEDQNEVPERLEDFGVDLNIL